MREMDTVTIVITGILLAILLAFVVRWLRPSSRRGEPADDDDPVVIAEPAGELEAQMLRSKLEAHGIRSYIRNSDGPTMPGGVPPALLGWEVLVRSADAEEAEALLNDAG